MTRTAAPTRALVFGASGHIGGPLARYIAQKSPDTSVRAATSDESKLAATSAALSGAEVVVASYLNPATLGPALDGVDAVFVITPDFMDEETAMTNLVDAIRAAGTVRHIVRITGDPPGIHDHSMVPKHLRDWKSGTAIQHIVARNILTASGLPVSYVNVAAYFTDDYFKIFLPGLMLQRLVVMPYDHQMAYIDPTDIGEAAGEILLKTDGSYIGTTTHLDNGHDLMLFSEAAELLSEVLGEKIGFDDTPEKFKEVNGDLLKAYTGRDDAADYSVEYFKFEASVAHLFRKTDIIEQLLDRKAKTLRTWFEENKDALRSVATTST